MKSSFFPFLVLLLHLFICPLLRLSSCSPEAEFQQEPSSSSSQFFFFESIAATLSVQSAR